MSLYVESFYRDILPGSLSSARAVLPVLFSIYRPDSVVDFGCGTGAWLRGCKELGVKDYAGIDGQPIANAVMQIEEERFQVANLGEETDLGRRFDLAISMEVAEHLPSRKAVTFVGNLCRHAPVVLFSAAIPYQDGTGHQNENWPEYWGEIFAKYRYGCYDCLRVRIWEKPDVMWWYKQNTLVYVHEDFRLKDEFERRCSDWPLSIIHPEMHLEAVGRGWVLSQQQVLNDKQYLDRLQTVGLAGIDPHHGYSGEPRRTIGIGNVWSLLRRLRTSIMARILV